MNEVDLDIVRGKIKERVKELLPEAELTSFLTEGSKCIRSKVALNFVKAFGKEPDETIYSILTSGELLHNASLLHDDVIDDSELRRGKTTLGKKIFFKYLHIMRRLCRNNCNRALIGAERFKNL